MFSMVVSAKTHLGQRDVTDNARKGDRFTLAFRRCMLLAKTINFIQHWLRPRSVHGRGFRARFIDKVKSIILARISLTEFVTKLILI